jgi:hypothetical protein
MIAGTSEPARVLGCRLTEPRQPESPNVAARPRRRQQISINFSKSVPQHRMTRCRRSVPRARHDPQHYRSALAMLSPGAPARHLMIYFMLVKRRPHTPNTISAALAIRHTLADSPKAAMPTKKLPVAPMPVQIA